MCYNFAIDNSEGEHIMDLTEEKSDLAAIKSCNSTLPDIPVKTAVINILLFYLVLGLGGYLLWVKSLPIFLTYAIILIVSILVHRYLICKSCFYY